MSHFSTVRKKSWHVYGRIKQLVHCRHVARSVSRAQEIIDRTQNQDDPPPSLTKPTADVVKNFTKPAFRQLGVALWEILEFGVSTQDKASRANKP